MSEISEGILVLEDMAFEGRATGLIDLREANQGSDEVEMELYWVRDRAWWGSGGGGWRRVLAARAEVAQ